MLALSCFGGAVAPAFAGADTSTSRAILRISPAGGVSAGWRLDATDATRIAERAPAMLEQRREHPEARVRVVPAARERRWMVSLFLPPTGAAERRELALVAVDDETGRVVEAWTGPQVAWPMARGYPGAFGGAANGPLIWVALSLLFALPFLRRPFGWIHVDIGVLLAFSLSFAAFKAARLEVAVLTAAALLVYLLGRLLWVARSGRLPGTGLKLSREALLVGFAFLLSFRVVLSLTGGEVIDVGYAGVIGADHLLHGRALYGSFPPDNPHGDTYGPLMYAAYVPWDLAFPLHQHLPAVPAARAASVSFDLLSAALCWRLGRRFSSGGGLLLAYLWTAYPLTLLPLASGSNDALCAALVLAAVLFAGRPAARGAAVALAGLAKLAPLALLPLLATYRAGRRGAMVTVLAGAATVAVGVAPFHADVLLERTVGYQLGRTSPLTIWGLWPDLRVIVPVIKVLVAGLVIGVAILPRRRDLSSLCALGAAVLIALQLQGGYWFYMYLCWFAPLAWAALLVPAALPPAARDGRGTDIVRHGRSTRGRDPGNVGAPTPGMLKKFARI